MKRIIAIALVAFLGATLNAAEIKGTVKDSSKAKNSITVTVDSKDTTYTLGKDASVVAVSTMKNKKGKTMEEVKTIDSGLDGVKAGAKVTLLTDTQDGKEVVTSVKVTSAGGGDDAKKKKKAAKKPNAKKPNAKKPNAKKAK
jgi:Cu/Ag efflux protein CusF